MSADQSGGCEFGNFDGGAGGLEEMMKAMKDDVDKEKEEDKKTNNVANETRRGGSHDKIQQGKRKKLVWGSW